MFQLTKNDIDFFRGLTNYSLSNYYYSVIDFFDNHENNVREFLSGEIEEKNSESFQKLNELIVETSRVIALFEQQSSGLRLSKWFKVVEQLSDIEDSLKTLKMTPRYAKSFLNNNGNYSTGMHIDHIQRQGESLENISRVVGKRTDYQDAWYELASQNKLREENTRIDDFTKMNVQITNDTTIEIPTIYSGIQNLIDTYGKDIEESLEIEEESGDFLNIEGLDCLLQSGKGLISIQGDNPYALEIGIPKEILGKSTAAFSQNILVTSIVQSYQSDLSFTGIQVKNIELKDDSFLVEVEISDLSGSINSISSTIPVV